MADIYIIRRERARVLIERGGPIGAAIADAYANEPRRTREQVFNDWVPVTRRILQSRNCCDVAIRVAYDAATTFIVLSLVPAAERAACMDAIPNLLRQMPHGPIRITFVRQV